MRPDIIATGFKPLARCPIAPPGSPISMSKASFKSQCERLQKAMSKTGYPENEYCHYECKGKKRPDTITFSDDLIKLYQRKYGRNSVMTVKAPTKLTCELCGEQKSNVKHKEEIGKNVCHTCNPLIAASRLRPESLFKAYALFNKSVSQDENSRIEELQSTVQSLRKELDAERTKFEKLNSSKPDQFYKGESNDKTMIEALKISEAETQKRDKENHDLMRENAKLENDLGNALEESRKLREDLAGLNTTLANRNSLLVANGNVLAKMRERGDIAFTLAEAVACEGSLLISQESILKIRGALS